MTEQADILQPLPDALDKASAALASGRLVAFPTETVYGLGASAMIDEAVAAIFEAKGRPHFNPLIVHVPDSATAAQHTVFDERASLLADTFWPGGLTLVLPRRPDTPISLLVSAGLDTMAVRCPAHPVAHALLERAGPLAAPSANASGKLSPTQATHVAASLGTGHGHLAMVLDGGECAIGLESTVIGLPLDGPATLLRPGAVPGEDVEAVLGYALAKAAPHTPNDDSTQGRSSPGQLASHYAPDAPIVLNATQFDENDVVLAFGAEPCPLPKGSLNLSPSGNLREAAAHLFSMLRLLDAVAHGKRITVMPIPMDGLGTAINDRLTRAAAPRP
ncbi:MAG: L-threonylcarbamoyladenylate synthase [Parvibaculaceae bacterium]|nr:L-threonylcarbamoyladenylate synthase [Parvibaculaceae bacterium]